MLLKMLKARNMAALGEGNSKFSRPVKCRMGRGIHMKKNVNRPIPVVHAFENNIERYGPMGETAQARALYKTSYKPYNTAPHAITYDKRVAAVMAGTPSPMNRRCAAISPDSLFVAQAMRKTPIIDNATAKPLSFRKRSPNNGIEKA